MSEPARRKIASLASRLLKFGSFTHLLQIDKTTLGLGCCCCCCFLFFSLDYNTDIEFINFILGHNYKFKLSSSGSELLHVNRIIFVMRLYQYRRSSIKHIKLPKMFK